MTDSYFEAEWIFFCLLCLRYEVAGGIMFSGCPSVRPYVRTYVLYVPYVPFLWSRYKEPIDRFLPNFGHVCILQSRELIRFWGHEVKGQRSQGSLGMQKQPWSHYLKNWLMDSCQTLVMYVSCRANEVIRFWGHEVKGQRSQGSLCMHKQLVIALSQEPIDGFLLKLRHACYLQSQWTE